MSNMWSQEEIDALLSGGAAASTDDSAADSPEVASDGTIPTEEVLSQSEIDTLGEIGNICMGSSATSMYTIVDRRVTITTPTVSVYPNLRSMLKAYDRPFVAVQVAYTEGIAGNNILLLRETDALIITDLMMGGDGINVQDTELGELQLSAISEVMNQMVGASATALANMLHRTVNIAPPRTALVSLTEDQDMKFIDDLASPIVRINFDIEIEGVLKSQIMQIIPLEFAKETVVQMTTAMDASANVPPPAPAPQPESREAAPPAPAPAPAPAAATPEPAMRAPTPPPPRMSSPPPQARAATMPMVDVQPVQYQSFDAEVDDHAYDGYSENIGIVIDVPLQVTVELGKTKKSIKEILDIGKGSIVVLDKLAGEMVEVLANGKLIARGEVVVIDDNYGVRITEVIAGGKKVAILQ